MLAKSVFCRSGHRDWPGCVNCVCDRHLKNCQNDKIPVVTGSCSASHSDAGEYACEFSFFLLLRSLRNDSLACCCSV